MLLDYLHNFIETPRQFLALGCVAVVWVLMMALGGVVQGKSNMRDFDHFVGWSLLSLFFTVAGVFGTLSFPVIAAVSGVAGLAAAGLLVYRRQGIGSVALGRIMLLTLPLILLAAAMKGSQWDEFTDWLVIPRYMLETGAFPSAANPYPSATFSGYPYSWHYIGYLSSLLAGDLLESAGALSNVFLLLCAAALLIRMTGYGLNDQSLHLNPAWGLCALAALAMTLVNPTFAQKVVLTAYADTPSAVLTGTSVILAWMINESLSENDNVTARRHAITLGFVLLLLVNIKQATLVLALLIVIGFLVMSVRLRDVSLVQVLKLLPYIIAPPLVIYLTWRYYLQLDPANVRELSIRPFDDWFIDLIPRIVAKMGTILLKKGYYLFLFVLLVGAGLYGFFKARTPFQRFAALSMGVVLGYNAFLLFAYVATFGKFDALRAASYWRYSMHLGMIVVTFAVFGGAVLWRTRFAGKFNVSRAGVIALVLIVAAPFVFAKKLRFDRAPMTVHYRQVGVDLLNHLTPDDKIFVADPKGSGESSAVLGYELRTNVEYGGFLSAFNPDRIGPLKTLHEHGVSAVIVFTTLPEYEQIFGQTLAAGSTLLLKNAGDGSWDVAKTWPHPG